MTVYPSRAIVTPHESPSDGAGSDPIVPAWLLAVVLLTIFALVSLASIEPFHYEGAGRHIAATTALAAYLYGWKEVFRRYLA